MSNVPLAISLSLPKLKMAGFRNSEWKDDLILKETLQKHVKDGLCREEILDFVARDFEQYPWSIRTLDRRLRHFEIYYHDRTVSLEQVQDACSRKVLWIKVWASNSHPKLIGRFYLDYLYEHRTIASRLRLDKGTETGTMATMHTYIRQEHGDMQPEETVIYGPSTSNQVSQKSYNQTYPHVNM